MSTNIRKFSLRRRPPWIEGVTESKTLQNERSFSSFQTPMVTETHSPLNLLLMLFFYCVDANQRAELWPQVGRTCPLLLSPSLGIGMKGSLLPSPVTWATDFSFLFLSILIGKMEMIPALATLSWGLIQWISRVPRRVSLTYGHSVGDFTIKISSSSMMVAACFLLTEDGSLQKTKERGRERKKLKALSNLRKNHAET